MALYSALVWMQAKNAKVQCVGLSVRVFVVVVVVFFNKNVFSLGLLGLTVNLLHSCQAMNRTNCHRYKFVFLSITRHEATRIYFADKRRNCRTIHLAQISRRISGIEKRKKNRRCCKAFFNMSGRDRVIGLSA